MGVANTGAGLLTLVFAASGWPAAHPTAVYTLDHRHATLESSDARGVRTSLEQWAGGCRIVEGGAIFALECEPAPAAEAFGDDVVSLPVTVALFRDLDEIVYLATCPVLDDERIESLDRDAGKSKEERVADPQLEADLRDCADVETGRTFSVELEGEEMRAVIRGRQLRLDLVRIQPKTRTTSTPYEPAPTRGSLGHAGPPTTTTAGLNEAPEPVWNPPSEPQSQAKPRQPETSLRDPGVAKTSLRAGRVRVECGKGEAQIWMDGAFLGFAPLDAPLPAGRHAIMARPNRGGDELETEIQLEAGETRKIDACRE